MVIAVSYSGNTEETLSCVARALPARLPAGLRDVGRAAGRSRRAARPAARRRAGRLSAARLDRFSVDAHRRRPRGGRPAARLRRAGSRGHRGRRRSCATSWAPEVADDGKRGQEDRPRLLNCLPDRLWRGRHGAGRAALEEPAERERRDPGVLQRAARARPQRAGRLGGPIRAWPGAPFSCCSTTPPATSALRRRLALTASIMQAARGRSGTHRGAWCPALCPACCRAPTWATTPRSTSPCCTASTRRRVAAIEDLKARLAGRRRARRRSDGASHAGAAGRRAARRLVSRRPALFPRGGADRRHARGTACLSPLVRRAVRAAGPRRRSKRRA